MMREGSSEENVLGDLKKILEKDLNFSSGKIIGSMCTMPHDFAKIVFNKYIETNIGDPGLFPGTEKIEKECIRILGSLLNNVNAVGNIVSGGTESNILALAHSRNLHDVKHPEVIVSDNIHHSFHKAANLLGLKLIPVSYSEVRSDSSAIKDKINSNTIMIVGTAGTTDLGLVDPIDELSSICIKNNIDLHVDASFGGFVIPFLHELGYDKFEFDFSLDGVTSLTIDPHKMGMAPIPSSCILFRSIDNISNLNENVDYLAGGKPPRSTILGTSTGASVVSLWAIMRLLGLNGYKKIIQECMNNTEYIYQKLNCMPNIQVIQKPSMNIIGFRCNSKSLNTSNQLDKLLNSLRNEGWGISKFPTHIRLVMMPHISRGHADDFLLALSNTMKSFD